MVRQVCLLLRVYTKQIFAVSRNYLFVKFYLRETKFLLLLPYCSHADRVPYHMCNSNCILLKVFV